MYHIQSHQIIRSSPAVSAKSRLANNLAGCCREVFASLDFAETAGGLRMI